jgi:hypothetical protein
MTYKVCIRKRPCHSENYYFGVYLEGMRGKPVTATVSIVDVQAMKW